MHRIKKKEIDQARRSRTKLPIGKRRPAEKRKLLLKGKSPLHADQTAARALTCNTRRFYLGVFSVIVNKFPAVLVI